jgi:hypothetical protein
MFLNTRGMKTNPILKEGYNKDVFQLKGLGMDVQ